MTGFPGAAGRVGPPGPAVSNEVTNEEVLMGEKSEVTLLRDNPNFRFVYMNHNCTGITSDPYRIG